MPADRYIANGAERLETALRAWTPTVLNTQTSRWAPGFSHIHMLDQTHSGPLGLNDQDNEDALWLGSEQTNSRPSFGSRLSIQTTYSAGTSKVQISLWPIAVHLLGTTRTNQRA